MITIKMPIIFIINIMKIDRFSGRWHFLSNFYPCDIFHEGIHYPSVEHFYVAMKFNDEQLIDGKYYTTGDLRELISKIDSPGKVKKIGKKIKLRKDWKSKKLNFMNWAIREKFKDPKLSELLISTGDLEIIEGNYWGDTYWGVCDGQGENNLGKILMKVRDELNGNRKGLEDILK